MKSMLIIASLIAVAVATPVHREHVAPGATGPAPVNYVPIATGPAPIDSYVPISVGPGLVDPLVPVSPGGPAPVADELVPIGPGGPAPVADELVPIATGPAIIEGFEDAADNVITVPGSDGSPLIQIIIKVNRDVSPTLVAEIVPGPVNFVDVPAPVVAPIEIGTPVLPVPVPIPVEAIPEMLN